MASPISPAPSAWNSKDVKFNMLDVADNSLKVIYKGPGKSDNDAAAVRANHPVPITSALFYFEVEILSKGRDGYIGVGLSTSTVPLSRLPGWEVNSFGYHGDDGFAFKSSPKGQPYGPQFTTGDVIGCCLNQVDRTILYTKNGVNLGVAFTDVRGVLFPTVGLRTPGECVEANFGSRPFRFDFEGLVKEQKAKTLSQIEATSLPNKEQLLSSLVLSYLVHHGYCGTATAFARDAFTDAGANPLGQHEVNGMQQRKRIREGVMAGQIDEAISWTRELAPGAFSLHPNVLFLLKCQKFVELVRAGNDEETMAYGRRELADFDSETAENKAHLQEVFSLLAYADPSNSPVRHILDISQRQAVADALNGAILASQQKPPKPPLETLHSQAVVVHQQLLEAVGGSATLVDLDGDLLKPRHLNQQGGSSPVKKSPCNLSEGIATPLSSDLLSRKVGDARPT